MRALQTIEGLTRTLPGATVIAYSTASDVRVFQQAVRAGAAFLLQSPVSREDVSYVVGAAARKRAQAATPPAYGKVIAVVGQKGGIGKTAISTNLAAALARETLAPVLIIDFDTTFGDVGLALDVQSEVTTAYAARSIDQMDRDSFKASLVEHESGVFVLPAPAHVGEWLHVRPDELTALVEVGTSLFDYVILDTPGAFNDAVGAGVQLADHLLVVTSLEMTSVKNTSLLLDALRTERYPLERCLVVANHTHADTGLATIDIVPALERRAIWEVPFDGAIRRGSQDGRPSVLTDPASPAARSLRALAGRLASEPGCVDRRRQVRPPATAGHRSFRGRLRQAMPFTRGR
jgi:pilus assembly protein CpaE